MTYHCNVQPFDFSSSPFKAKIAIPKQIQVIFVADIFVEDYVGGAELTSEALIVSSPFSVFKLKSSDVTMDLLRDYKDKFWVFGNFSQLNFQLVPSIIANLKYSVLEYDYKFCRYRSPEKHFHETNILCDCVNQPQGKLISDFYQSSMGVFWMSEAQRGRYLTAFPKLAQLKSNIVLSSVFSPETLSRLHDLRSMSSPRKDWVVLGSRSWIKGFDDAEKWCKDNDKDYEVVWNVPYDQVLQKLASAEGFVYLPKGGDTCPRMVIEAKLLGCKLHINDNVQHRPEDWFRINDLEAIHNHLAQAPRIFWDAIRSMMQYRPTISGYTTVYNAIKQQYPFEQCIKSMLAFCDEVCVVDGGSDDGTLQRLQGLMLQDNRIRMLSLERQGTHPMMAVLDGALKAKSRAMCTQEFCWQMDSDEIVHEDDADGIIGLCKSFPKGGPDLIALPVIEYWGGPDKVRMDVQPWKWRLSRNLPHITHGIPLELRRFDSDGHLFAAPGTDGCDMIDTLGSRIPFVNFYTGEVEQARLAAMAGNQQAHQQYEAWFNQVVANIPGVFHYSWYDLPRKMKLYRDFWQGHWNALWGKNASDTAENNLMFGVPWSQVTDEMIEQQASQMKDLLGGWIWHRAWDGKATTPHIKCNRTQPKVMLP